MEFEIIKVEQQIHRLLVEIEITGTRERKHFGYPLGEGWENEIDGEFKFVLDIKSKLEKEKTASKQKLDFSKINKKVVGKKIKLKS